MEKYGFIYIWYDIKHKRYYIGSHWGTIDDGYICSSNWMRDAYRRRPEEFKRKILEKGLEDRTILLEREFNWLSKIKQEELGTKYYNLQKHKFGHWSDNLNSFEKIKIKLQKTKDWKEKLSKAHKGKIISESTKQKISKKLKGRNLSEETKTKIKENHFSKQENYIPTYGMLDKHHSVESKKKISSAQTGNKNHMFGKKHSDESKKKISEAGKNRKLSTESKRKISETKKKNYPAGPNHYCNGRIMSTEAIEKIKVARSKQVFSEESKQKMRDSAKRAWQVRKNKVVNNY